MEDLIASLTTLFCCSLEIWTKYFFYFFSKVTLLLAYYGFNQIIRVGKNLTSWFFKICPMQWNLKWSINWILFRITNINKTLQKIILIFKNIHLLKKGKLNNWKHWSCSKIHFKSQNLNWFGNTKEVYFRITKAIHLISLIGFVKNKLFLCIKRSHFATKLKSKVHMDGKLRLSSTDKDIIVNACKIERIRLLIDLLLFINFSFTFLKVYYKIYFLSWHHNTRKNQILYHIISLSVL